MQIRKALMMSAASVALAMATTTAKAADSYVSLFGGLSLLQNSTLSGSAQAHTTYYYKSGSNSLDLGYKTGFVLGGNWGLDWGTFRTEIELAYRENNSSKGHLKASYRTELHYHGNVYTNYAGKNTDTDADIPTALRMRAYSLMANVWYDFHGLELPGGLTPYVGGGIGSANVQLAGRIRGVTLIDTNNWVFAWQLGAGVSVPLSDSLKAFLDYRYFAANGVDLTLSPGFHQGNVSGDFNGHSVLIGLRLNL